MELDRSRGAVDCVDTPTVVFFALAAITEL
jgi:hypothetical protein